MSSLNLGIDLAKYVFQQPNIQMLDLVHLSSFLVNFEGDYATILDFKVTFVGLHLLKVNWSKTPVKGLCIQNSN